MKRALVVLVVAACQTQTGDDFAISPGGPGGPAPGSGTHRDASLLDTGDGGTTIAGRICLVSDLRALTTCAGSGADGITVTLGGKTATTAADGRFTIEASDATNLVWHARSAAIVTSAMPLSTTYLIPAILGTDYLDLLNQNGATLTQGIQGSIVVRVVHTGTPLAGAKATVNPVAQFGPFYDGTSATTWDRNQTSTAGVVWMPGEAAGSALVTITPTPGAPLGTTQVVEADAITFGTIDIP